LDNCGKTYEQVKQDFSRDFWMSSSQEVEYGIIDKVAASIPPASGPYRLVADRLPVGLSGRAASPIMLKAVLESWCYLNCSGPWDAGLIIPHGDGDAAEKVRLDFNSDEDAVLFMLSPEYGYMGRPPLKTLTI
jgi:hypothetical protein